VDYSFSTNKDGFHASSLPCVDIHECTPETSLSLRVSRRCTHSNFESHRYFLLYYHLAEFLPTDPLFTVAESLRNDCLISQYSITHLLFP